MRYVLDDANKFFEVSGLNSTGNMLKLDANTGLMGMGDVSNTNSHIGIYADDTNSIAYVDGLKTEVPNWTPSDLADKFTGTGLNDMQYDNTVNYSGVYPNTCTATYSFCRFCICKHCFNHYVWICNRRYSIRWSRFNRYYYRRK